jgi:DNA-binding transcriptional MerR regulator
VPDRRGAGNNRGGRRFDDRDVERLNRLAWWDRPPAEIEAALAILERGGAAELERHFVR